MVKQQVHHVVPFAHVEPILASHEREADAQFQQEVAQVTKQPLLQIALAGVLGQGEEVERVGVFQQFAGQVGLRSGQSTVEVGDRLSLTVVQVRVDVVREDVTAPAVLGVCGACQRRSVVAMIFSIRDVLTVPRGISRLRTSAANIGRQTISQRW